MGLCIYRGKNKDGDYKCLEDEKRCYGRLLKCAFKEFVRSAWGLLFALLFVGFTFLAVGLWQVAEERVDNARQQSQGERIMAGVGK